MSCTCRHAPEATRQNNKTDPQRDLAPGVPIGLTGECSRRPMFHRLCRVTSRSHRARRSRVRPHRFGWAITLLSIHPPATPHSVSMWWCAAFAPQRPRPAPPPPALCTRLHTPHVALPPPPLYTDHATTRPTVVARIRIATTPRPRHPRHTPSHVVVSAAAGTARSVHPPRCCTSASTCLAASLLWRRRRKGGGGGGGAPPPPHPSHRPSPPPFHLSFTPAHAPSIACERWRGHAPSPPPPCVMS
jgi:hypothetical protein